MAEDNPRASSRRADDAKCYWLEEGWSPGGYIREGESSAVFRRVDSTRLFSQSKRRLRAHHPV